MEIFNLDGSEYIELYKLLKAVGFVENGLDGKNAVSYGLVKVNGEVEYRKGNKIRAGDVVEFEGQKIKVVP